ncbi:LON peptidase substrate-binding domain-containing protein [Piscinibacter terrae]|uniref:Peptidase S16 n=1 Tax=Piscinibacter terrae TaxID=2496871 RepID=A0A3N7HMI7_9BURK|nr:LON peptidase substrate-binding domain-containing protein [Albitalea terrae]RQP23330.1 peptidase S16 [Albitalea terrae]
MPSSDTFDLPLFPLQTVLFPGGLLSLKVFEARYLDLVGTCLRESRPFGVVSIKQGSEVRRKADDPTVFETIGVMAELIDVDSKQPNILMVRCKGTQRFEAKRCSQQGDGLWVAQAEILEDDDVVAPAEAMHETVRGLANAIATMKSKGSEPFLQPYAFDNAGWVANRWCEILPISIAAKQKLMELDDPHIRLQLVNDFLRSKGVVS